MTPSGTAGEEESFEEDRELEPRLRRNHDGAHRRAPTPSDIRKPASVNIRPRFQVIDRSLKSS